MIRTTFIVLFGIAIAGSAAADGLLVYKSKESTGYAWVLERGNIYQVPCYRTIRDIDGKMYVRNHECNPPADDMSDIAIPSIRWALRPPEATHYRIMHGGNIKLF